MDTTSLQMLLNQASNLAAPATFSPVSPTVAGGVMPSPPPVQPLGPAGMTGNTNVQAPGSAVTAFANSGAVDQFRQAAQPNPAGNAPMPSPPPVQSQGAQQNQGMQQIMKSIQQIGKAFGGMAGANGAQSPAGNLFSMFGVTPDDGQAAPPEQGANANVGDTTGAPQGGDGSGGMGGAGGSGMDDGGGDDGDSGGGFDFTGGGGFSD